MDALSEVLKSVRLEGAAYLNAELTAPWCTRGRYGVENVRDRLAGADHVVYFHFIVAGSCRVRLAEGGEPLEVIAGDLVLFPRDDFHLMGSDLQLAPVETSSLTPDPPEADGDFVHLHHGGGGLMTRFVCGYLACTRSLLRPLLDALPRMVRIPMGSGAASHLVRELLRAGVRESAAARPGGATTLAKLAELMFVEALRSYAETLPPQGHGWLAGLRDVYVGRTLALLHGDPGHGWSVAELARRVALSRSALAARFTALVGEPPMQYLTRWRLALAAQQLRAGRDSIARIAERSGYDSETSFSRAFKREFGVPPAAWRRVSAPEAVSGVPAPPADRSGR
jgi:AraC-like DNA-binding protein